MATSGCVTLGTELRAEECSMDITESWDPEPSLISQLRSGWGLLGQAQRKYVKLCGEVLKPRLTN